MISRGRAAPALVLVLAMCVALAASPASAHADTGPTGNDLQVAQTLGERELTVVIRRVDAVPGPVRIEIVTHAGSPPGTLELRLAAAGAGNPPAGRPVAGIVTSSATLILGADPGLYGSTLDVDRPGPWELAIGDGKRTARVPFVVPARVIPRWESVAYGGFASAGALLLVALILVVHSRRAWVPLIPAAGMVVALAVAITAALLSPSIPPSTTSPAVTGSAPPPVNLVVHAPVAVPGQPVELALTLTDGSTGRPVDDLLVHHNALMHLVVIGPSGQLRHLHPIRLAPGDYQASFVPPDPGTYAVSAELARRGGGVQLVRSPLAVQVASPPRVAGTGSPAPEPPAPEPPGPGTRVVDGTEVELSTTSGRPAGTATTIAARIGDRADLQLWLGMAGHLIIVGPLPEGSGEVGAASMSVPTWAHAHAMAPVSNTVDNPPDETVAAFGPTVQFTYTFATPGRYRIWIQVERNYSVLTIPAVLDVPAGEGGPP